MIDLLRKRHFLIPDMEQLEAGEELLGSFDIDCIQPETLLFQTGYVTIQKRIRQGMRYKYYLSYPNLEVKMSLTGAVLNAYTLNLQKKERLQSSLYIALEQNNLDSLGDIFHAFFASIPHDWYRKNALSDYEGYYASIVYCYFAALGLDVTPEDTTNHGRIDLSIRFAGRVYLLEFKVNELTGSGQALAQLKEKKYHEKYQGKEVYLIGIEFSKTDRNITRFECEKVDS
ncbi:MAG: PD-(D/E)XK nuclease domain-containing protein [Thermodesulfobacteriota bacterium]|nr:PD-(D/E)XK nuclease domain-containing protein [Thermodesulfobacteriota bacterium]